MPTEMAAEYPHLSPATQRDNDINYPPILVLLIGLISSFICGVLNFGQGMTFAVLWNLSKRLNLLDYNTSFSKGIMYGQILSLFALIPVLAVGWREVFKLIGYSSIMLGIMNYVREEFLRHGEFCFLCFLQFFNLNLAIEDCADVSWRNHVTLSSVRDCWGASSLTQRCCISRGSVCPVCMAFSAVELLETSMAFGIERSAKQSGNLRMVPEYERRIKLDETETVVLELQENQESACIAGTPHWPVIEHILDDKPRLRSLYERILPSISFRGYAVETVLVVLKLLVHPVRSRSKLCIKWATSNYCLQHDGSL